MKEQKQLTSISSNEGDSYDAKKMLGISSAAYPYACLLPSLGSTRELVEYREHIVTRLNALSHQPDSNAEQKSAEEISMLKQVSDWLSLGAAK